MTNLIVLKENEKYSVNKLMKKFRIDSSQTLSKILTDINDLGLLNINKLKNNDTINLTKVGIYRLFNELSWGDLNAKITFSFRYVGIIQIYPNITIVFYPKYFSNRSIINDANNHYKKFKQIVKVIQKYKNRQKMSLTNNIYSEENMDILGLKFQILNKYYESGLYNREKHITTINGKGTIDWNKTINGSTAHIINDIPIYIDLYANERETDFLNIVSELHGIIVTEISLELEPILDILDMEKVELTHKTISDFGDIDFLVNILENEINHQFITWKLELLQELLSYLEKVSSYHESDIQLFGTDSFNLLWEDVCSYVYKNHLEFTFCELNIINPKSSNNIKLKDYIEKPKWRMLNQSFVETNDTLRLDVLNIENGNFNIYDAKYYNITLKNNTIIKQPGVNDLTKQYLYQLAFKDVIKINNLNPKNAFIIPKDDLVEDSQIFTVAIMDMFHEINMNLKEIQVIARDCEIIFDQYLSN